MPEWGLKQSAVGINAYQTCFSKLDKAKNGIKTWSLGKYGVILHRNL